MALSRRDPSRRPASRSALRAGAAVAARLLFVAGALLSISSLICLLFACSPANTADAPALVDGAWKTGALGVVAIIVGTLLARFERST